MENVWNVARRYILSSLSNGFSFDFEAMMEDLRSSAEDTVVILHAAAHNPTGAVKKSQNIKAFQQNSI